MNDINMKKELQSQYKEREIIGGVFIIKNTITGKILLDSAADLQSSKNRFEFAKKSGSCINMKLQADWNTQNGEHFVFEVLEELKKGETQTQAEFKADIALLKTLWLEKLADETLY